MTMKFYVRHRGQVRGPIDVEQLGSLAAAGKLQRFHELARAADGPWARADEVIPSLPFASGSTGTANRGHDGPNVSASSPATRDVFISHSSKDKLIADGVCARLESQGIRCWVAPRDIPAGAIWGEAIIDGLSQSRLFVLILSQHANVSHQVMREVERAVSKGIPVIPVRIEDVPLSKSMEYFLSSAHWLDAFAPPFQKHLDSLVHRIQTMISTEAPIAPRPLPQSPAGPPAQPTPPAPANAPQETVLQTAIKATHGCFVATLGCIGVVFVLGVVMTIPVMLQLPKLASRQDSTSDSDATKRADMPVEQDGVTVKAPAKRATRAPATRNRRTAAAITAEEMQEMSFQQILERFGEPEEVYRKPDKQNLGVYIWKTGEDDYAAITFVQPVEGSGQMHIASRFVHLTGALVAKLKKALDEL